MFINIKGLNLIKTYEGFSSKPYLDVVGIPTIGYGNTYYEDGTKVTLKDEPITVERATQLLTYIISSFERSVEKLIKVPINENQFSALVSFAYNVGIGSLQKSTLLKKVNARDFEGAAGQFLVWNKARVSGKLQVVRGLTRRRKSERDLWIL